MIRNIVEAKSFQNFITGLIILNGITLGMGTSKELVANFGNILALIDGIVIGIFTIEILMRISVYKKDFFKDPWSLFDFVVVIIALVPASGPFAILRVLRVLRLFRLLTIIPQMRTIVGALIGVIPGIGAVSMVLLLFFYVFAIMATTMYGEAFPQWFGTLGETMYTLFQIMTLESWSMGIARPVIEVFPYAWIFFVIYILLVTFVMVNLFIGLIVDAIFTIKHEDEEEQRSKELEEISALRSEIQELKELIKAKG